MAKSNWHYLCVACLLSIGPLAISLAEPADECGRILSGPSRGGEVIYVFCPLLPELSTEQARSLVVSLLNSTTRISGDVQFFFLSDESVLHRDWWWQDQGRLIESLGDAFVGAYHTRTGLLTIRPLSGDEWRNISVPTS